MDRKEVFYAAAYWGPRVQGYEECVACLGSFLEHLSSLDSTFSEWFMRGKSPQGALRTPVSLTSKGARSVLIPVRDDDGDVAPELGFVAGLWNGRRGGESAGLDLACSVGSFAATAPNSVILDLPYSDSAASRLLNARVLLGIMSAIAMDWKPDWGVVTSDALRNELGPEEGGPFAGWVTYVSNASMHVVGQPLSCIVQPVGDIGTAIAIDVQDFSGGRDEHVALARQVSRALRL